MSIRCNSCSWGINTPPLFKVPCIKSFSSLGRRSSIIWLLGSEPSHHCQSILDDFLPLKGDVGLTFERTLFGSIANHDHLDPEDAR